MPIYVEEIEGAEIKFSGVRLKRGLYRSKSEKIINTDVNVSYNILRKAFALGNALEHREVGSSPTIDTLTKQKTKGSA